MVDIPYTLARTPASGKIMCDNEGGFGEDPLPG